ncbi:hypothetical protein RQP46_002126 [Phenoliferia psychrophenolica]
MASDDEVDVYALLEKEVRRDTELSKLFGHLDFHTASAEEIEAVGAKIQEIMSELREKLPEENVCVWEVQEGQILWFTMYHKAQKEMAKSIPKGVERSAAQRIELWVRHAMTELECAIVSAEHCHLKAPNSLSTSHSFTALLKYDPNIADDSLCFTLDPTQCDILPNDVISELMERPVEDRQAVADVTMRSNEGLYSRMVHVFFVFGEGGMYFFPFGIRADRETERQLGKYSGAPDWWQDPDWKANLVRRLEKSAFAKDGGNGLSERCPTHLKGW